MDLEMVVVRSLGGEAYLRWLIPRPAERVAYITNQDGFLAAQQGLEPEIVVGFPWGDVFRCNPALSLRDGDRPDWEVLELWRKS